MFLIRIHRRVVASKIISARKLLGFLGIGLIVHSNFVNFVAIWISY